MANSCGEQIRPKLGSRNPEQPFNLHSSFGGDAPDAVFDVPDHPCRDAEHLCELRPRHLPGFPVGG